MTSARRPDQGVAVASIAAAAVAVATLGIWLVIGVTIGQALRFTGYELAYVFLPGLVLYRTFEPGAPSALRKATFAFALGQVIEVLLFALTAGIGIRPLFDLYPIAFALVAAVAWYRKRQAGRPPRAAGWRVDPRALAPWSAALAAVCLLALVYIALTHYLVTPLPGQIDSNFTYQHDYLFHLSLAGEALHHWPLTDPNVSGTSLHYHWFSYFHIAGMAQVTGIPLPTVDFALFQAPLLLLLLCELALAGSSLGGVLWAGPIAALLLIFVGEIDLSKAEPAPFLEVMPIYLRYSPPFLFGATLFVPLVQLGCEMLGRPSSNRRQWVMLALVIVGCAGAEATTVPIFCGGVAIFAVYRWLISRRIDHQAVAAFALGVVAFLLAAHFLYAAETNGLELSFPGSVQLSPPFTYALPSIPGGLHTLFWVGATVALLAGLFGAVAIGLAFLSRPFKALRAQEAIPLGAFLCGLLAVAFLFHESGGERYFGMYGTIAVIPLSAAGLARLLGRWRGAPRRSIVTPAALAIGSVVVFYLLVFNVHFGASPEVGPRFFRSYGPLVIVLLALVIWVWLSPKALRGRRALYPVIVLLAAAVINIPSDYRDSLGHLWSGKYVQGEAGPGLTPQLYEGLSWIEGHSDTDAVLAVDNLRTPETRIYAPLYFYIAAFAERRTFLQGWEYNSVSAEIGYDKVQSLEVQPFPDRAALQSRLFEGGSAAALRTMERRYGVSVLVVDRQTGIVSPRFLRLVRPVYANPAVVVYVPR